ncbi:hypothetical protein [Flavobacterium sp.]|uniref:hypothetical protein n=1 Tax=Flavobacterium sp. TaxID=239 RepID=UPI00391D76E3
MQFSDMKYYTIHINDSGAIEDTEKTSINGENTLICKMYDDPEFNKLNDILHSLRGYILNEKALNIFKESNTISYKLCKAKVLRKEKIFGFIKKYKEYDFYELNFLDESAYESYEWIDFEKSKIFAVENLGEKIKIKSHQETLSFVEINKTNSGKSYSFETEKIVFNKNFNSEIDLFKIPFYSWGIYVSEKLKNKLENAQITDIGFAENKERLGIMWKPHFPIIEFNH